jgi:hypothetical protein
MSIKWEGGCELWSGKVLEGSGCSLFEDIVLAFSWRIWGKPEKNLRHDRQPYGWKFDLGCPAYAIGVLTTWPWFLVQYKAYGLLHCGQQIWNNIFFCEQWLDILLPSWLLGKTSTTSAKPVLFFLCWLSLGSYTVAEISMTEWWYGRWCINMLNKIFHTL